MSGSVYASLLVLLVMLAGGRTSVHRSTFAMPLRARKILAPHRSRGLLRRVDVVCTVVFAASMTLALALSAYASKAAQHGWLELSPPLQTMVFVLLVAASIGSLLLRLVFG